MQIGQNLGTPRCRRSSGYVLIRFAGCGGEVEDDGLPRRFRLSGGFAAVDGADGAAEEVDGGFDGGGERLDVLA